MKLLLTSSGFANDATVKTLVELVGKPLVETTIVFVPTASNVESGDKSWFIKDLVQIKGLGFKTISIADISAVEEDVWRPQFEAADVLFFEGGDTYHLMSWVRKSGLEKMLPEMFKSKVWVGVSAGSMILGTDLNLRLSNILYGENVEQEPMRGLGYVDFYFFPHLNSSFFPARVDATVREALKDIPTKTYVLEDGAALKVVDGVVERVGEGQCLEFN